MKHQWLAYLIVAFLSIGAGVAIAGLPDSVPENATIVPPTTTTTIAPTTTVASPTTTPTATVASSTTTPATTGKAGTSTTTSPSTPSDSTSPTALADRDTLAVAVANGSGRDGVAQRTAVELEDLGYVDVAATSGVEVVPTTIVYYTVGKQADAERLAADLGLARASTGPIDLAPDVQELGLVHLLVYAGVDRT